MSLAGRWFGFVALLWAALPLSAAEFPVLFEASQRAILSADLAGSLNKFPVEEGSVVKKGALLAQVDYGELILQRKKVSATLNFLSEKLSNLARLRKSGLAGREDEDQARMERDMANAELQILKRQINQAAIRAPFNATVVQKHVREFEWVQQGQPVVELVNTAKLKAVANVSVATAVGLKVGDEQRFSLEDLPGEVRGKITALVPDVDVRSNTLQVIWEITHKPAGLLAGMRGAVQFGQ